jgi:hypothetical protein
MAFYIVETNEQLTELFDKGYDRVFIEPVYYNDNIHPALNDVSLLYIKPLNNDKGYILCLDHNESLSLNKTVINGLLTSFNEIYLRDRKSFLYFFPLKNTIDISFFTSEYQEPTTQTHEFFYQKHGEKLNINVIIPLVKHYERCELIFDKIKEYCITPDNLKFYNKLINVFFAIEKNGIKIDEKIFNKYYELTNEKLSISNNTVYTQYNLYTTTGRPSNSFNGINFAALVKDNGCREAFIPRNDKFIEIDITAYHPTLAAQLINFDFKNETPYQYLAREANVELSEAKILMFRQLYGGIYKEYQYIEFLQSIQEYVKNLWDMYSSTGSIRSPISGHTFENLKDINPQKLFNYLLQNLETSNNVLILWDIVKILKGKSTKIVLYTYDSILIDYNEDENILEEIKQVFNKYKLKIKLTTGENYGKMA